MVKVRSTLGYCVYFGALALCSMLLLHVLLYECYYRYDVLDYRRLQARVLQRHGLRQATHRGLLVCLTDATLPLGLSLVKELRTLGSRDAIFAYHCMGALSPISRELLRELDVVVYDACADLISFGLLTARDAASYHGEALTLLALLHAPIEHVIVLDAGNVVFADPSLLWSSPAYAETGTRFFYEREVLADAYLTGHVRRHAKSTHLHRLMEHFEYGLFRLPTGEPSPALEASLAWHGHSSVEQDLSMLALHKVRIADAFPVLWHLLRDTRYRIPFSKGTQELLWLSLELVQMPYAFSPWAETLVSNTSSSVLCGSRGQYLPSDVNSLFYLRARDLVDPYLMQSTMPGGMLTLEVIDARAKVLEAQIPSFVGPRRTRSAMAAADPKADTCLANQRAEPLFKAIRDQITRRVATAASMARRHQARLQQRMY
ncbi:hypothetical protein SDRG_07924 [Saprolegnia diclina VS20]|uniref:Nucleotide-diphospho-sugar transferase domain-containing protein n=1 Tax=Saprolegnia diclina (strain VS20) TaxID=1156394 RepID=T0QLB9_SAPDV|nr:hypothetical protein SDRG_07924 [Saprolegnia diclina VS20]EQC34600.1 hypothetical protein SDRG_07924 [Saprolegnia diclina VS20]|eukprot:XP_008612006.1 hypothetical protein SDRG_07924 [Saprolegnia diclina VS20]